jgi:uncharacterized protein
MKKRKMAMYRTKQMLKRNKSLFWIYVLLLFLTAITRDFGTTPLVSHFYGPVAASLIEPGWKLVFWISPVLLYITFINRSHILTYLKLRDNIKQGILWGGLLSSLFLVQLSIKAFAGGLSLNHSFNDWLNSVILVGLIEELVFRGFLYQQLRTWWWKEPVLASSPSSFQLFIEDLVQGYIDLFQSARWGKKALTEDEEKSIDLSKWIPNQGTFRASLVSTLLFVGIHLPVWIIWEHISWYLIFSTSLFNFLFGLALCTILTQSVSLWSCILLHTLRDLQVLLNN